MSDYHEPWNEISEKVRSQSRALNSLREEIEAVAWYNQRVDVEKDATLKGLLRHNMLEEIEHACMTIEWLRRNMDGWDKQLKHFIFKEGDISHH